MAIYYPSLTFIDVTATKHYASLTYQADISAELLSAACMKAQLLAVPKGIWQLYTYDQDEHTILGNKPLTLTADSLIRELTGALEVAIMAATIGLPLELEVSDLFTQNQATLGMLLDAAGTTAIETTSNAVYNAINQQAAQAGLTAGRRISLGNDEDSLELQPKILELSSGSTIGLSLTDTKMLVPRKSITAIIGLYPYHYTLSLPHQQDMTSDKCGQTGCQARKEK